MTGYDMTKNPRFDYIFSYWIFLWFLAYIFRITTYNPKWILQVAILENLLYLCLMLYYQNSLLNIGLFLLINFIIKAVPLWLLWNTFTTKSDLLFGAGLVVLYFLWLTINNINMKNSFLSSYNGIKHNIPVTPFIYYGSKILGGLL